ncbi:MAG: GNAT family N-acetyltransferase [Paracoccaceae bacterium]
MTFRAGLAADAAAIQALLAELAVHDGVVMRGSVEALLRHGFGARPLFRTILAVRDDAVLGLALFYPDFSTLRGRPGAYVQDLYVSEAARGLGLGRRLLAEVMASARDWEAGYITLTVDRGNASAQRFYARQGFADRGAYEMLILEGAGLAALNGA